jgi:8-oxo-dGTP pyrophosphatase MutT (NUDIX family)
MYTDWVNAKILQKAVVLDKDEKVLLIKRAEKKESSRPGSWDFPGGNVDSRDFEKEGEIDIHLKALKREIMEETGLVAGHAFPIVVYSRTVNRDNKNIFALTLGYKVYFEEVKPKITLSDEHTDFVWVKKQEVYNYEFGFARDFFLKCIKAVS